MRRQAIRPIFVLNGFGTYLPQPLVPAIFPRMSRSHRITILAGDGIGPEVMSESLRLLDAVEAKFGFTVARSEHLVGGAAIDATGHPLPPETVAASEAADAIHFGPPTEPKRMASAFSQACTVSGGSGWPVASIAAPPTRCSLREMENPNFASAASRIRTASVMTSGPMPSPARIVMRCWRDMRGKMQASRVAGKCVPRTRTCRGVNPAPS